MNAQAVMKRCVFLHFSVYLQPQSHSLGHGRLGEDSLYVRHELSGQSTAFWTNQITFLLNSRNHSKVEREVGGNDSTDSLLLQLLLTLQVCKEQNPRKKKAFNSDTSVRQVLYALHVFCAHHSLCP